MMKKGFTLAEVLITLAIIGVVATLTLPALMTNTSEQQYITGLKKGINTLAEAGQMSESLAGYTYGSFADADAVAGDDSKTSMFNMLITRAKVDTAKSGLVGSDQVKNVFPEGSAILANNNYVIFFQDGSALSYDITNSNKAEFKGLFDVNGAKAPNLISNCGGRTMTGIRKLSDAKNTGSDEACNTPANRIVKDQFPVVFSNGNVMPASAIGRWAMSN